MNQAKAGLRVQSRKSFKPLQSFFTDARKRRRNRLLHHGKNRRDLRVCGGIFSQTFRRPKHLIRIPADPGPPERADLIDDLRLMRSPRSQIPAMDNDVWRNLPQVRDNGLEGAPIPVNIRYDRDSHFVRCRLATMTWTHAPYRGYGAVPLMARASGICTVNVVPLLLEP